MKFADRIIVALDVDDLERATSLVKLLDGLNVLFKLGLEFFTSMFTQLMTGPSFKATEKHMALRDFFAALDGRFFWDGKWADIPNTVKGAANGLRSLSPMFINVHASAGIESVKAAVANKGMSKVLGVTLLTSFDERECMNVFSSRPDNVVAFLSSYLKSAGCDGIICSPQEIGAVRGEVGPDMLIVTPGVRPEWASSQDQKRVKTPGEAIKAGATHLVIGRPITEPPKAIGSPIQAVELIVAEIEAALQIPG